MRDYSGEKNLPNLYLEIGGGGGRTSRHWRVIINLRRYWGERKKKNLVVPFGYNYGFLSSNVNEPSRVERNSRKSCGVVKCQGGGAVCAGHKEGRSSFRCLKREKTLKDLSNKFRLD